VKIGRQDQRSSGISTSNAETIVVRGRDLAALVGSITFTEHFWLLLTGALPTPAQLRILDATLVAIAEHGLVPSVQAARMTLAAAPEALQGAVAAGILGCGSVVLGSAEAAGRLFAEIQARTAGRSVREACLEVVPFRAMVIRCTRVVTRDHYACSRSPQKRAPPDGTRRLQVSSRSCCPRSSGDLWH
jgi:citrate synthase